MKLKLIVLNGFTCTGKTTLARSISDKYSIPSLSADSIKDIIIDTLGISEELFGKYSTLSYKLMYEVADEILRSNSSVIVEASYHNSDYNVKSINKLEKI